MRTSPCPCFTSRSATAVPWTRPETAVNEVRARFAPMVQRVDWSANRETVTVTGAGFIVEMRIDPQDVHVSGDIPLLGALLGRPLEAGLRQIVDRTFGKMT
jgi:hypothetical protein